MTRKKPSTPPSAKQLAARADFADKARSRGKVKVAEPTGPAFEVGDIVRIKATPEHPVVKRGRVVGFKDTKVVVNVGGYDVRFYERQLVRVQ
jgi:ribosomal protein L21E